MANAERRADAAWDGDLRSGSGTVELKSSGAAGSLPVSFPSRAESPSGQTSPEELIAGAHATCYAMALSNTLSEQGSTPEHLDVSAVATLDLGSLKISTVDLNVHGRVPGLDEAGFQEAAQKAEQVCPVSNALRGNVEIRLNTTLDS